MRERPLRCSVYFGYLLVLVLAGPLAERDRLATTLWLVPLTLVGIALTTMARPGSGRDVAILCLDTALIGLSAGLRGGAADPILLAWFPVLVLMALRRDQSLLMGGLLAALTTCVVLQVVAPAPAVPSGVVVGAMLSVGALLLADLRAGSALVGQLDAQEREVGRLSTRFSRYFSPQVAQILASEGTLATGRQPVSVLFADLSGFTRFTEQSPAEIVVATLGEYLDELCRVALRHGGTIDKFMGDEVMVVWNAPMPQADHARRALACGRDMQLVLAIMNEERSLRGRPVLGLSVGINSGEAVVGNFGGSDRVQYTVIGDTVNVAKRLQGLAGVGEIMAGSATIAGAGERMPVETVQVKGRSGRVEAARLLGRAAA